MNFFSKSGFIKLFLAICLISSFSLAKEDYSEMSNEELIAIMGYIKEKNKKDFKKELQQRIPTMNEREKKFYEKNLKQQKGNR